VFDLRLIESFVVLSEDLHFGRAATRLALAQPALSQQMQRLELQIGAELFVRSSRRVSLSPAGEGLLPHAREILRHASLGQRAAVAPASGEDGTIRIACSLDALEVSGGAWDLVKTRLQRVHLHFHFGGDADALADVRQDRAEAALIWYPSPPATFRSLTVARAETVAVFPENAQAAAMPQVSARDLDGPLVLFDREISPVTHEQLVAAVQAGSEQPLKILETAPTGPNGQATIIDMVRNGFGFGVVTKHQFEHYDQTGVVARPLDPPIPAIVNLMWLEDQASSALNRIIEILAASAAESNLSDAPIEANAEHD
jgi:DNA-binding transcriptional LysR family regulator